MSKKNWWLIGGAVFVVAVAIFLLITVNTVKPGAGEEIVLIDQPMIFGHGGIQKEPVKTGQNYIWWTTKPITVNMQPQQFPVEFQDLMTSDGVPLGFHAVLRLRILDSVKLISNFGADWYERNVKFEFQNRVRQAVRNHGMNETAISTTAVDAIDVKVFGDMNTYFKTAKIPLEMIAVTMGKANPPDAIKNQRVETATQQQRIQTETQRKLAEDSRLAAEKSRAAADNAYRNAMGLDPSQFIQLEQIHMMDRACTEKDSGHCTFILNGSGLTPTLNIPVKKDK